MGDREDELRQQLATAESISHIGSWEWTIATNSVRWSDELYRIYGFEPRSVAITLEFFLSRILESERERIQREIQHVLQHAGGFAYREQIVRPDGSLRTLDTIGQAVTDDAGSVVKLVGTCRDITDVVARDIRLGFYADVFEHADIGLSALELVGNELQLVAANETTARLLGTPSIGVLSPQLLEIARGVALGVVPPQQITFRAGQALLAANLFPLPNRHVGLALEDVTARTTAEVLQAGERRALEMLAAGGPLDAILSEIVLAMERASFDTIASILLLDQTGTKLAHGAAPHLPAAYNAAIDGLPIGPRAGSCGTAMYRREPVFTSDIETDPLWTDYRDIAREHGLRSCWSFPIIGDDGRVYGSFALYHRTPAALDDVSRELMERAAHVACIVLERRALDEQRRALPGRIEAAREDERTQIARDVHDQLGQALTALKLDIGWLQRRAQDEAQLDKLADMARAADDILRSIRRIAADLRPGLLDQVGLRAAIEWQAEDFEQRTSIPVRVHAGVSDLQLDRGLATNMFRIFQEALTNIARHASAQHVDVTLGLERGQLRLEIADDGVGVPEIRPSGTTLGILGMRERAWRLGGECTVKRADPHGTIVTVVVPLRFPADRSAEA